MPVPNYLQPSYFGAMDQSNYFAGLDAAAPVYIPINANEGIASSGLSVTDLGVTNHPMQNQLQALQAKIREGASKMEFEFAGTGKGNSQSSTPESYGQEERLMMRKLAEENKLLTSTHASFGVSGLAGMGQRGFDKRAQQQTVQEVQRAIDFAKDATTGGAIVVHTGEWQRPVSHYYPDFEQWDEEDKDAQLLVVDNETGEFIQGITKRRIVATPRWMTAKDMEGQLKQDIIGKPRVDVFGNTHEGTIQEDDFVDVNGKWIDPTETDQLFRRVPDYDEENSRFNVRELEWNDLQKETEKWNEKYGSKNGGRDLTPEEYFAQLQIDNQILQSKGQSTYYIQPYERAMEEHDAARKALEFYESLENSLPAEEKWRIMQEHKVLGGLAPSKEVSIPDQLREVIHQTELQMRHIHEASSAADARAKELERQRGNIRTIKEYGLEQTGRALARLAMEAMEKTEQGKRMRSPDERFDPLFIAPENWHPSQFGSHPEELLEIVREGRRQFKEKLGERGITGNKADKLAETHIKTTFDIGHLNMWRSMLKRKQGESEEQFDKRFKGWAMSHLDALDKENAIGHLHLTDNFGYNDEHLAIGQGNAPVKEFVEWALKHKHKDFIVEPGSYNGTTIMPDAWSFLGAVNWKRGGAPFRQEHLGHAGWYAPPNYLVGAYVPSNEWTLWSQVPLE